MSLFRRVWQAVGSWGRRGGAPNKERRRAGVAVEQLDHRRLLSVNFTGNVTTDFPATNRPGVVVLPADGPPDQVARPSESLEPLIKVSGFAVTAIRVAYDPADDTLNFGLEQPINPNLGLPVIAGDADNSGVQGPANPDSGTVDPNIPGADTTFLDPPDLDGSEYMGVFLDLNNDKVADVVAGKSPDDPNVPKLYQVALAVPRPNSIMGPAFGAPLPSNTGNVYLVNDPRHGGFEFAINNFSTLFGAFNGGRAPTAQDVLNVGAAAGSSDDPGVSETFISFKATTVGEITPPPPTPPPPPVCPPLEPPIMINPHQQRHVNTAHPTDVRVAIFGSAGFDVRQIVPESLRLGGAGPILSLPPRRINRDKYPDQTFVFKGSDISLPPGIVDAVLTGTLRDGQAFRSTFEIFNRDDSFYTARQVAARDSRQERAGAPGDLTPAQRRLLRQEMVDRALAGERPGLAARRERERVVQEVAVGTGPTVSIPMTHPQNAPKSVETGTVNIRTRPGHGPVKPRKLRIDTRGAARSG